MHLADAFIQSDLQCIQAIHVFISMCVPWESNPQPFALLTQCSTTEPQEHYRVTHRGMKIIQLLLNSFPSHLELMCHSTMSCFMQLNQSSLEHICLYEASDPLAHLFKESLYMMYMMMNRCRCKEHMRAQHIA